MTLDSTNAESVVPDIHLSSILGKAQLHVQTLMTSIRQTLSDAGWTKHNSEILLSDSELAPQPTSLLHNGTLLFCLLTPIYWKTEHNLHPKLFCSLKQD